MEFDWLTLLKKSKLIREVPQWSSTDGHCLRRQNSLEMFSNGVRLMDTAKKSKLIIDVPQWSSTDGHCLRRANSLKTFSNGVRLMDTPVMANNQKLKFISSEWTLSVIYWTCQKWSPMRTDGGRGWKESMLTARLQNHDDNDDDK